MDNLGALLPLLIIVVLFYFLLLRPARRQQQRVRQVQTSLAPGSRVVTSAGVHGTVVEVGDGTVVLETAPSGVRLTFERAAIVRIVQDAPAPTEGSPPDLTAEPSTQPAVEPYRSSDEDTPGATR